MNKNYDVCVIGSGAGAGPVILELSRAGKSVVVLEKGPWLKEADFFKDEMACCRRSTYTPDLKDEQHVLEEPTNDGSWISEASSESGWDFWNGNVVGGSSNFMSGYFYRLKPEDFRLHSEFGAIEGANITDWPISYDELEPIIRKSKQQSVFPGISFHTNIRNPDQPKIFLSRPPVNTPLSIKSTRHVNS